MYSQHLLHQLLVGGDLPARHFPCGGLQIPVHQQEHAEANEQHQRHPPVEQRKHSDDQQRGQQPLSHHHHHACGHILQVLHHVGGHGGDLAKAVFVEVAHGQVAHVLGDLNAFHGAGVVARLGLQHRGLGLGKPGAEDAQQHDSQAQKDVPGSDSAVAAQLHGQHRAHHHSDCRDFERLEKREQHAQPDGGHELFAVCRAAEVEEAPYDLNHCPSPPYGPSTSFHTGRDGRAAPHACRYPRYCRCSRRRSLQ